MPADPDMLVTLATARTEIEGAAMRSVLEAEGIPTRIFAGAANMLGWEGGYGNTVRIMVRRGDAVRAAEAIAVNRRTAQLVDWSQVDVGEFEDGEPPAPADPRAAALAGKGSKGRAAAHRRDRGCAAIRARGHIDRARRVRGHHGDVVERRCVDCRVGRVSGSSHADHRTTVRWSR